MSILNVNQIQPVGSGQTVTISAANITASSSTITANTFSGALSSSGVSTFSDTVNVGAGKSIRLYGASSGYSEIVAAAGSASTTFTLPANGGSSGQYLQTNGSGSLSWAGAGKILQVVQTTKTDTFSTSNTSFTDITGLSVSITPSSASSKILVYAGLTIGNNTNFTRLNLVRNSTSIFVGDAAGSRIQSTAGWLGDSNRTEIVGIQYLDSPATTSSTTYKMQISNNVSETCYVGRSSADSDNTAYFRCPANIIVMEVAA